MGMGGMAVGAAAGIAGGIYSMVQGDPDRPELEQAGRGERRARRGVRRNLRQAEGLNRAAVRETNMISPLMYDLAGYDVTTSGGSEAGIAAERRYQEAQGNVSSLQDELGRTARGGGARKRLKKRIRRGKKGARRAQEEASRLAGEGGEQITSITDRGGLGDEREREIHDLLTERVLEALRTGESTDPRLNRELAEQEGELRATLSQQFGMDYENTTPGSVAMAEFRQRRAESLADFARQDMYAGNVMRLNQQTTLAGLAGQRQDLLMGSIEAKFGASREVQTIADRFLSFADYFQSDRHAQLAADTASADREAAGNRSRAEAISSTGRQIGGAAGLTMMLDSQGGGAGDQMSDIYGFGRGGGGSTPLWGS